MPLPPLLPLPDIHERLREIFPEGTANRNYVIREIAAKTVFVMLYIGAVTDARSALCGSWSSNSPVIRVSTVSPRSNTTRLLTCAPSFLILVLPVGWIGVSFTGPHRR